MIKIAVNNFILKYTGEVSKKIQTFRSGILEDGDLFLFLEQDYISFFDSEKLQDFICTSCRSPQCV